MSENFIDKYEIVETLGRGSMGVVYKARDPEIGRLVAIKTLKSVFMGDDTAGNEALQRFRQESRSAGKLHHPNIVTIFEAGRTEAGSPYIVMEYIEGKSLETLLQTEGALEPFRVLHYLSQIASAIDYAHSQSVIHRDIKPSNIIVDNYHRPHLLDFGVAKLSDTSLTPAGTVVGTPSYMSPEQIRGLQLDGRTDVFSLAVVAFEALTGSRPFPGNDFTTVVSNIIHKEPLSFAELNVAFPAELEVNFQRVLAKDRDARASTALDAISAVAEPFGIVIDGMGLVGGYSSERRWTGATSHASSSALYSQGSMAGGSVGIGGRAEEPSLSALELARGIVESKAGSDSAAKKQIVNGVSQGDSSSVLDRTILESDSDKGLRDRLNNALPKPRTTSSRITPLLLLVVFGLVLGIGGGVWLFAAGDKTANLAGLESEERNEQEESADVVRTEAGDLNKDSQPATADSPSDQAPGVNGELVAENPGKSTELTTEIILPAEGLTKTNVKNYPSAALNSVLDRKNLAVKDRRLIIAEFAGRPPSEVIPALLRELEHTDFQVRVETLKAFSKPVFLGQPEVTAALLRRLSDEDELVRGFAAKVLQGRNSPEIRAELERRMQVEKSEVVLSVIRQVLKDSAS